ncbi:MAG: DinB family protein [Acidobacteria bacterium]|nr:DinB family protein [Acidobacteriota bacterium]
MGISADILLTHFDYTLYATSLLLEAAAKLTPEERERDLKASYVSLLGTLRHIYFADRIWLSRFEASGSGTAARLTMSDQSEAPALEEMAAAWPGLVDRFKQCIRSYGDSGVMENFTFTNLAGKQFTMPRYQAMLHVVNHGTLHRGQVMMMLRQLSHVPPSTDLLYYYR